ncbi:nodulate formation efficiency C protein [Bradyrhizobium sp. HKCCYLRH1030]|uniref:nodulate formation efficiency C protein n=1 Tax=Bradyrhizobium sp. HKCCYLRH1030 TaxID=3420744 RepID=UPI003EBE4753
MGRFSLGRAIIIGIISIGIASAARAEDDSKLIQKVKTKWRAQSGEAAEEIIAKVSKVAHFVPRGWEVARSDDRDESVVFSWARRKTDKADDEFTFAWDVAKDGKLTLGPPYAKPLELGWQAFALSLIGTEVSEDVVGANRRFLHDPTNLNFVTTPQGKLGDLLRAGRCTIGDPVGVDYLPKLDESQTARGNLWRVQISVDCNIPGPRYYTRDGIIIFEMKEGQGWEPQSLFAKRIASNPPGSWFDRPDPKEREIFDVSRRIYEGEGLPSRNLQSPFPR